MGQHGQAFFFGKGHQLFGDRAIGIGAVVQVEFANALVGPTTGCALGKLGLHHGVNRLVLEPTVVVGPVAVQADKGHHRHPGLAG